MKASSSKIALLTMARMSCTLRSVAGSRDHEIRHDEHEPQAPSDRLRGRVLPRRARMRLGTELTHGSRSSRDRTDLAAATAMRRTGLDARNVHRGSDANTGAYRDGLSLGYRAHEWLAIRDILQPGLEAATQE